MNPGLHKRYIDYRDKHAYFGHPGGVQTRMLGPEAFAEADAELRALKAKGKERTVAEQGRLVELEKLLFLD